MIKLTSVKIKDNDGLRGVMAEKKLSPSILETPRVLVTSERVHEKIHSVMMDALNNVMDQISGFADTNGVSGDNIRTAMENNIKLFRIDAGSGYTQLRKEQLIAEGTLTADEFEPLKKAGGGSTTREVTGEIEL